MISIHNRLLYFLFLLLPFSLVTGPFIPDLSISIMGMIIIYNLIKNEFDRIYFLNYITLIFFLFYLVIFISSLLSDSIKFSLESSLFYFRFYFFSLAIVFILHKIRKSYFLFFISLLICLSIISIDGIFEFINGESIIGSSASEGRVSGLFRDEWVIGSYLVRLLPLLVFTFFMIDVKNIYLKCVFYFILFICVITITISGERAALINICIYSFLMFCCIFIKFKSSKLIILIPFFISILCLPFFNEEVKVRTFHDLDKHTSLDVNKNVYLKYYDSSFKMFLEKPVLGHGPNLFRLKCSNFKLDDTKYGCNTHPHNSYFQLLAETGLLGFTIILFFFFFFIKELLLLVIKNNESSNIYIAKISLILTFIINLWPLIPTMNFFGNWINILYFFPMGFYLKLTLDRDGKFNPVYKNIGSLGRTRTATGINPTGF